jgi:hypothetical protein
MKYLGSLPSKTGLIPRRIIWRAWVQASYRDLALNVEVGWIMCKGMLSIQEVRNWCPPSAASKTFAKFRFETRAFHVCTVAGRPNTSHFAMGSRCS